MNYQTKLVALLSLLLVSSFSFADGKPLYEVTITNVTKGQTFTPQLVATHTKRVSLFDLGEPVSTEIEIVAEGGDTAPLTDALNQMGRHVGDVTTIPGLLGPGQTISVTVEAWGRQRFVSVIAMLIPTNDTFFAVNGLRLPSWGETTTQAIAYDAGTELNDQSCANMPGPRCGGEGYSPGPNEGDEGYAYVSNGFHDLGDVDANGAEVLGPLQYDWRNPVAIVKVRRVK